MEPSEHDWSYENGETSFFIETGLPDILAVQFELHTFSANGQIISTNLHHYYTNTFDLEPEEVIGAKPYEIGDVYYFEASGDGWLPVDADSNQIEVIKPDEYTVSREQLVKQGLLKLSAGLIIDIAPIVLSGGMLEFVYLAENLVVDESLKYTLEAITGRGFRVTSRITGTVGNLFPIVSEVSSPSAIDGLLDLVDATVLRGTDIENIPYSELPTIKALKWIEAYLPLIVPFLRKNKQLNSGK